MSEVVTNQAPSNPAVGGMRVGFAIALTQIVLMEMYPYLTAIEQAQYATPIVMFTTVVGKSIRKWFGERPAKNFGTQLLADVFGGLL